MTRHDITKRISITYYTLSFNSLVIGYKWGNEDIVIYFTFEQTLEALKQLGEIESFEISIPGYRYLYSNADIVVENGSKMRWQDFIDSFVLSQWDVLNIVINFEWDRINRFNQKAMEIDTALKKINVQR